MSKPAPGIHRLITISISHYCEKARWALDRGRVAYAEQRHVPVVHVACARRAGGGRTLPVLVSAEGEVLPESAAILRWVDRRLDPAERLYPAGDAGAQAARLEAWFDEGLGPDDRLWMYQCTLAQARRLGPWLADGTPRAERWAMRWASPLMVAVMRRALAITPANAAAALDRVDATFDEVASMLSDGRPYLCGERFTAADLTFAALSAPVLGPEVYGAALPSLDELPESMVADVRRLRDHDAGRFAQRIVAEQRRRAVAAAP